MLARNQWISITEDVRVNRDSLNNRLVKVQVFSLPTLSQLEANEYSQYCLGLCYLAFKPLPHSKVAVIIPFAT